jgi:hypothetical protein
MNINRGNHYGKKKREKWRQTYGIIAPYAASLAPITNMHQNVAVTFHIVVFDSFHLVAILTACGGAASSSFCVAAWFKLRVSSLSMSRSWYGLASSMVQACKSAWICFQSYYKNSYIDSSKGL